MSFSTELIKTAAFHAKVEALRHIFGPSRVNPILLAAAQPVINSAQAKCHVLTGTLKRSIRAEEQDGAVVVGSDLPYAAREEFGFIGADSLGRVYNYSGQPYLRPAIDDSAGAVMEAAGLGLKELVRSIR